MGTALGAHPSGGYNRPGWTWIRIDRAPPPRTADGLGALSWGELGPLVSAALPECEIAVLSGETHLTARVRDEAELFGLLERLRDLGAALVSVSIDP
jgi:hypothetical protein